MVIRRITQLVISVLASKQVMANVDLPDMNFIFVSGILTGSIMILLTGFEKRNVA